MTVSNQNANVVPQEQPSSKVYVKHVEFDDEQLHQQQNGKHQANSMRNKLDMEIKKRMRYGGVKAN